MQKLIELVKGLEIIDIIGSKDIIISSINYDSRKCDKDSLFVAISGSNTDGHRYIKSLVDKHVKAIICEHLPLKYDEYQETTFITVKNSRKALAVISDNWFDKPSKDLKIIGITGTNGKTTITYLLKSLFESVNIKTGIIGTTGIFIGDTKIPASHTTPESLELTGHLAEMKLEGVEIVLMEVSSHALYQRRVSSVMFDIAVFTNLTHEHLDYHKTIGEYAEAKKLLFKMLPENGIAIVNGDDDYSDFMLENIRANCKIKIGRLAGSQVRIENERLNIDSTEFELSFKNDKKLSLRTELIGRFNIDNAAFTAVIGEQLDIQDDDIIKAMANAGAAPGRMQKITLSNGAIGIVDYAHTPDALEKALLSCKDILRASNKEDCNLISVFGCGGNRDKEKRPLMGAISSRIADCTILTGDNPRKENPTTIIEDIFKGISEDLRKKIIIVPNRAEAIAYAFRIAKPNDLILVAGKGHENYQIIGSEKFLFDDIQVLKDL